MKSNHFNLYIYIYLVIDGLKDVKIIIIIINNNKPVYHCFFISSNILNNFSGFIASKVCIVLVI